MQAGFILPADMCAEILIGLLLPALSGYRVIGISLSASETDDRFNLIYTYCMFYHCLHILACTAQDSNDRCSPVQPATRRRSLK